MITLKSPAWSGDRLLLRQAANSGWSAAMPALAIADFVTVVLEISLQLYGVQASRDSQKPDYRHT